MSCYVSYKKRELLKTANYLLNQNCCDEYSCTQLVDDLQDLQFKCNDVYKNDGRNRLDADEKGNIKGTVCSNLRDKKNKILEWVNGSKMGGNKKIKRTTKRLRKMKKVRKIRKLVMHIKRKYKPGKQNKKL